MLQEHELQVNVYTAFSSSPKLSKSVSITRQKNGEHVYYFKKTPRRKKDNSLLTLIIKV